MMMLYLRILAVLFLSCSQAWAADDAENVITITPWPFYIAAIVIGIWVSIFLSRMAHSGKAKITTPEAREKIYDRELESSLEQQLASVVASKENRSQIARSISGVVAEKMSRKISEVRSEVESKFETAIKERDKEQEILHLKYKNVVAEKNQTEAIVQSLAEGLVVVNSKGEVVMMNPAAEKILGISKEQKVGKLLTQNLKGEEVVSLVSDVSGEKTVELSATQMETKKIIRSSSAVVENENGQTVGMVSVLTDITKQKELDRLKSQFVSTVSHELRTPIVATQKALAVMMDKAAGPLTEDQARFLDIANRNLGRLSSLINDILDFSKLEAGKMKIELVETSIGKVVEEACEGLVSWANSKDIRLIKNIQDNNIPQLKADPNRIIQILNNLIGNALKFTPKGGSVTVEVVSSDGGVRVSVQDTGMGIPKEDLNRVFEKFLQLGERRQTDVSGTGLGLSIAKDIVELHGGKIWAESEQGQGAKFIFTLPKKD
ncbi:MAG: ATP-binding protein [Candidatus Omnitrophota bacterium]